MSIISSSTKLLERDFTLSQHRRLTHPLPDIQVFNLPIKQLSINNSLPVEHPINEWVYYWDETKKDIVFGKTISRENDSLSSITYFQHYTPILCSSRSSSSSLDTAPVTPTRQYHILVPCKYCSLHSYYPHNYNCTCVVSSRSLKLLKFHTHKKLLNPYNLVIPSIYSQQFYVPTKPVHTYKHLAYNFMLLRYNKGTFSNNSPITSHFISSITNTTCYSCPSNTSFITHAIIDGSVINLGTPASSMEFGWLQVHHASPKLTFTGKIIFLTSSTRAELFSILSVFLVVPAQANVQIYTDSATYIQNFHTLIFNSVYSVRQQHKQLCHTVW
ncbi:ribonuclease H-like domain-containing protein [Rhizophagus clarus]|uniref:Ribonuclease H-like domain-containing protein n=1 Tax=Rhizophagus clarus TaxID=94130 RepID=A0A8H3KWI2_9GLOM|nr:ribonuclease H-like domain-containing protein [Rhizophagus clarus]